jgi:hypothetical protein
MTLEEERREIQERNCKNCVVLNFFVTLIIFSVTLFFCIPNIQSINNANRRFQNECCQYETFRYDPLCHDIVVKEFKNGIDDTKTNQCISDKQNNLGYALAIAVVSVLMGFSIFSIIKC